MARIGGDFSPPSMPSVESSPPPSQVESAPKVEAEAPAAPSKSESDIHAMPPTDSFERKSSPNSVSSTSPTEKTETRSVGSVGAPSSRATQNFDSSTKEEIKKLAGSEEAEVKRNKDESETRTRKTQEERTTRERQLTERRGLLREEQTKYTDSTTRTQQNGTVNKETFTSRSDTDLIGRQTSSNSVERSRTRGAVESESGQTKTTTTRTTATDQFGNERATESRATTNTQGPNDKNNVARTTSTSTTSDERGNRQNSQETKTVNTNGTTTVTRTSKTTDGSALTTQSSAEFKNDKASLGEQVTFTNKKSVNQSISRETELRPGKTPDQGFTQQRGTDRIGTVQNVGDVAAALGARTTLAKNEIPKSAMQENAWSQGPNSFVGTRQGTAGKYEVNLGGDGLTATGNIEKKAGFYAEANTPEIQKGQAGLQGGANFTAEMAARAKGNFTANLNGVDTSGSAKIGGTVETSLTGRAQSSSVTVGGVDMNASATGTLKASATLAAEAKGKVQLTRNPPAAVAEGSLGASAVVKAEGETTLSAGPFSLKANAYGSYGAEATVGGSIGYENGKLKLSANMGAALGLGVGGGASMEVDVAQIGQAITNSQVGQAVKNTAVRLGDANGDGRLGLDDARVMANNAVNTARNTVNSAASTVRSWLGW